MAEIAADTAHHEPFVPSPPTSVADTGLGLGFLTDLAVKTMYLEGTILGYEMGEHLRLPHANVVEDVFESMRREKLCEVKGTATARGAAGLGSAAYRYEITDKGRSVAREAMQRSQYVGPAPVPLPAYNSGIRRQPLGDLSVHREGLEGVLSHLVIDDDTMAQLGAAVNSRRSMFLFGPPGNGKTAISEGIGDLVLRGSLFIPYAIESESQVIKVFDGVNHKLEEDPSGNNKYDRRWLKIRRPVITVGGEMTLAELDLIYEPTSKYYEAPLQMKANGGMLLIDDFGRQQARPRDLLNRWIVPLEKRSDFLTLHTGRKVQVPFDLLVVFATNIAPKELVDEAFLRRIRHKIEIEDPTWEEYRQIFRGVCQERGVPYNEQALAYLIREHYAKRNRAKRGCHPRDLVEQIRDIASYLDVEPVLTKDLIDKACSSYFVDL
ncbi:MAG: ATP-binding protein [Anaerolineae bacterium]|jgi:predicted ATPase with chaperone activity